MDVITIDAQTRDTGKKALRAVRNAGNVPCILYGHDTAPVPFAVAEMSLNQLIYTDQLHVVQVKVGDEAWDCILKDVAFHPVSDLALHADFQVLTAGEAITLAVPVHMVGTAAGQLAGGDTTLQMHELEVSCLPKDIPEHIEVDVTHLEIGDVIHVEDLNIPGLEFTDHPDQVVVVVTAPRAEEPEELEEDEMGEAEAATEEEDEA